MEVLHRESRLAAVSRLSQARLCDSFFHVQPLNEAICHDCWTVRLFSPDSRYCRLIFQSMHAKQKTAYHPYLIVAFYLHFLPPEWKDRIPRSTRYDWQQKRQSDLFGYEWCQQHQQYSLPYNL